VTGTVVAVSCKAEHGIAKPIVEAIRLIAGEGVEGDAHCGTTVMHRSRVAQNPEQPNLRQVHLIHAELLDELTGQGFAVAPGDMGENVTTRGVDLLALPEGAILEIGEAARIAITGLRNPCHQLDELAPGLMQATLDRDERGHFVRKAGVMAVVVESGEVRAGDTVTVHWPDGALNPLGPV
jgi:MOSC domain-containing protein YiiM